MTARFPHLAVSMLLCLGSLRAAEAPNGVEFFESKIRPLFEDACVDCHGPKKQKGDLRLDSAAGWKKGGASGAVIVPGKPEDSLVISAVRYWNKDLQMPPKHALESAEVDDMAEWVKLGAPDPREAPPEPEAPKKAASAIDFEKGRQHWAFQPFKNPAPPEVKDKAWAHNEVDLFTLLPWKRLASNLRRTLLRMRCCAVSPTI